MAVEVPQTYTIEAHQVTDLSLAVPAHLQLDSVDKVVKNHRYTVTRPLSHHKNEHLNASCNLLFFENFICVSLFSSTY